MNGHNQKFFYMIAFPILLLPGGFLGMWGAAVSLTVLAICLYIFRRDRSLCFVVGAALLCNIAFLLKYAFIDWYIYVLYIAMLFLIVAAIVPAGRWSSRAQGSKEY